MTLPITDSILRGELRPNILKQSLEPKALELLIRNARKVSQKSQLLELEFAINDVLSDLVNTKDIYAEDKKTRDAAINARKNKISKNDAHYKFPSYEIVIDNVLTLPELSTPLLRFYNTIIDAEILRTRQAILHMSRAVQDDAFVRSTLKALFRKIKFACQESQQWEEHRDVMSLIPIKLTHLYFTLLNTYGEVLQSYDTPEFEDDFMDFVYRWKGEYPSNDEVAKYIEQSKVKKEIGNSITDIPDSYKPQELASGEKPTRPKDKADLFLEGVSAYNFFEMPMIKQLITPEKKTEKVHYLVMMMLENSGHACAMLEYLKFFEWIKRTQRTKFTKDDYDALCSKVVMGLENGSKAFHTVRMSLNSSNKNAEKYKAYVCMNKVENEYVTLLNS